MSEKRKLDGQSITEALKRARVGILEVEKDDAELTPPEKKPAVIAREEKFGIRCFLSTVNSGGTDTEPLFTGFVKRRNCDFVVREITNDGEVLTLKSMEVPKIVESRGEEDDEELDKLFEGRWSELKENFSENGEKKPMKFPVGHKSKEDRAKMHKAAKQLLETPVNSNTSEEKSKESEEVIEKFLVIEPKGGKMDKRDCRWPAGLANFLHFTLCTEGVDTVTAASRIGRFARIPPHLVTYSGTKDKAAVVFQRLCVKQVKAQTLAKMNPRVQPGKPHYARLKLGDFSYEKQPLFLGCSKGNRFSIVVRCLEGNPEVGLKNISETGFINYFGLQRFGTTSIATSEIGKALYAKDWKLAVDLILRPRDGAKEETEMTAMREAWGSTEDAKGCLKLLPKFDGRFRTKIEFQVLDRLAKTPGNYHAALGAIPRNMRSMYCHAYQSLIWNKTVSKRIEKHGLKVLPGDLLAKTDEDIETVESKYDLKVVEPGKESETTLDEIVIPLVGYAVMFPKNDTTAIIEEILKHEGLSLKFFSEPEKSHDKFIETPGGYRKIIQKAKDLSWRVEKYKNFKVPLVDIEFLSDVIEEDVGETEEEGLVVEFSLPSSTYATMALREAMRSSSEVMTQKRN